MPCVVDTCSKFFLLLFVFFDPQFSISTYSKTKRSPRWVVKNCAVLKGCALPLTPVQRIFPTNRLNCVIPVAYHLLSMSQLPLYPFFSCRSKNSCLLPSSNQRSLVWGVCQCVVGRFRGFFLHVACKRFGYVCDSFAYSWYIVFSQANLRK